MFWEESLSPALASVIQAAAQYDDDVSTEVGYWLRRDRVAGSAMMPLRSMATFLWR